MSLRHKYYDSILIASLLSVGNLLASLSVLADQNSPTPAKIVENQVTAQFTNALDGRDRKIVSDKVTITVAEGAASNVGVLPSTNAGASDE